MYITLSYSICTVLNTYKMQKATHGKENVKHTKYRLYRLNVNSPKQDGDFLKKGNPQLRHWAQERLSLGQSLGVRTVA